jgi:hypothetical protein
MASLASLGLVRRWSPVLADRGETRNDKGRTPHLPVNPASSLVKHFQTLSILRVPNGQPSWRIQHDDVIFLTGIHRTMSLAPMMKQLDVAPLGIYACPTDFV